MKTKAYIIKNNIYISETKTELKNGADVIYSYDRISEEINANREYNLVNGKTAKISRAKKWDKQALLSNSIATEIETGEFYIS